MSARRGVRARPRRRCRPRAREASRSVYVLVIKGRVRQMLRDAERLAFSGGEKRGHRPRHLRVDGPRRARVEHKHARQVNVGDDAHAPSAAGGAPKPPRPPWMTRLRETRRRGGAGHRARRRDGKYATSPSAGSGGTATPRSARSSACASARVTAPLAPSHSFARVEQPDAQFRGDGLGLARWHGDMYVMSAAARAAVDEGPDRAVRSATPRAPKYARGRAVLVRVHARGSRTSLSLSISPPTRDPAKHGDEEPARVLVVRQEPRAPERGADGLAVDPRRAAPSAPRRA